LWVLPDAFDRHQGPDATKKGWESAEIRILLSVMGEGPSSPFISLAGEYTLRALVRLTERGGGPVTTAELAEAIHAPTAYLTRTLRPLIDAGVLSARRGVGGGYTLVRDPASITLLDALRIVGGCRALHEKEEPEHQEEEDEGPIERVIHRAEEKCQEILSSATLADLADSSCPGGSMGAIVPLRIDR
jgi:Rrf2 family protein